MDENNFSYQFYQTTTEAWDAMYQAILAAKKSIYWEVYIFIDDMAGARFVDALCAKAAEGVDVKMILDSLGSRSLSPLALARLRGAGVEVLWYNKLYPELHLGKWFDRLWERNHRKVIILDEQTAFLGGVNVSAEFGDWYDLHLKLQGKVVRPLSRGFAKMYLRCGGEREKVSHLLHPKLTVGMEDWRKKFNFVLTSPIYSGFSPLRRMYFRGLALAKESFSLLTPYYLPDINFLRLISKARSRGVKVNLFLPVRSDYKILDWIARGYYELTCQAGAKIFLLDKMNHGKAMSVDGESGFMGSGNFLPRSFFHNEEAGVYFNDERMVNDLNGILNGWKDESNLLDADIWKKRNWRSRFKEWWAKRLERFM